MAYDIGNLRDLDRLLPATRTTRPEIARSHLTALFADHDLRLSARRVDFSHQQATLVDAAIGLLRYGTEVEVVAPALDCYVAQLTLDGGTLAAGGVAVNERLGRWAREAAFAVVSALIPAAQAAPAASRWRAR